MAAVALDNVIRFPDQLRAPGVGTANQRMLNEARDLVARRLCEALRTPFGRIADDLMNRGDIADDRETRNFLRGAAEVLRERALPLEGLLAIHWQRQFDRAMRGADPAISSAASIDELHLVDLGAMDEDLAVRAFVARLTDACEEGLYAVSRRLGKLCGRDDGPPTLEAPLAEALRGAFVEADLDARQRLEVWHGLAVHGASGLTAVVHDLNATFVAWKVLPDLKRSYRRPEARHARDAVARAQDAHEVVALLQRLAGGQGNPSGPVGRAGAGSGLNLQQALESLTVLQHSLPVAAAGAPIGNVVREFRQSSTGQSLGQFDAVTVDIVAMLFDLIFDDKEISDPIKALVARLQIPVLKVAMLDNEFFASKAHPARRLLDGISRAAVRFGRDIGHDDPLYRKIGAIVERLQAEFVQDVGLFDRLCQDLEGFVADEEAAADARAAQAAPLVAERERRELAQEATDEALAVCLGQPLPAVVSELIMREWRELMVIRHAAGEMAAWQAALEVARELAASVRPLATPRERKQLATRLPGLVKRIHEGLSGLSVANERRLALFDALFGLHAMVLRGGEPEALVVDLGAPESAQAQAVLETACTEAGDTLLESISVSSGALAPAEARERVAALNRGDWLEFAQGEGEPLRYRLAWISPQRGILLFTNPQSPRALAVSPDALALKLEKGEAFLVDVEPIFERAVNRALGSLENTALA